jgi:hypothetical protein
MNEIYSELEGQVRLLWHDEQKNGQYLGSTHLTRWQDAGIGAAFATTCAC